jgi:hypothetical protein
VTEHDMREFMEAGFMRKFSDRRDRD